MTHKVRHEEKSTQRVLERTQIWISQAPRLWRGSKKAKPRNNRERYKKNERKRITEIIIFLPKNTSFIRRAAATTAVSHYNEIFIFFLLSVDIWILNNEWIANGGQSRDEWAGSLGEFGGAGGVANPLIDSHLGYYVLNQVFPVSAFC